MMSNSGPFSTKNGGYQLADDGGAPSNAAIVLLHADTHSDEFEEDASLPTVGQLLRSRYAIINIIVGALFSFGINVGITYAIFHSYDYAGLFVKPSTAHGSPVVMVMDIVIASFLSAFLGILLSGAGIRKAVSKGQVSPINDDQLDKLPFRLLPLRVENIFLRALYLGMIFLIIWGGISLAVLMIMCFGGGLSLSNTFDECSARITPYIYIRALWGSVEGAVIYPFVLTSTVNRKFLSKEVFQQYLANRKQSAT